jgi:hypothetical protein
MEVGILVRSKQWPNTSFGLVFPSAREEMKQSFTSSPQDDL